MTQQLINAVALGSIYALFTLGLSLVWGVLGLLNLAHGSLFAASAYAAYRVAEATGAGLWLILPAGMLFGGLAAVVLEVVAFRPIRARAQDEHQAAMGMLIGSIGASTILVVTVQNLMKVETLRLPDSVLEISVHQAGDATFTNLTIIIVAVALILGVSTGLWVRGSHQGRALRALAYDAEATTLFGVNASRVASTTMFVGGALAGGAGVLLALNFNVVSATMGEGLLLKAFAVVIIGGVGNIFGALAGGYLLAFAEMLAVTTGHGDLRDAVAFGVVILVLLVRPGGLFQAGQMERA
jgi:branched-chain amino acid transport system permease protein